MSNENPSPLPNDFEKALVNFVGSMNVMLAQKNTKLSEKNPAMADYYKPVELEHGTKNIRVVFTSNSQRHVHCFIDKTTGSILKPAGWKAPAKGVRGSIYKPETYAHADAYGGWLYRR